MLINIHYDTRGMISAPVSKSVMCNVTHIMIHTGYKRSLGQGSWCRHRYWSQHSHWQDQHSNEGPRGGSENAIAEETGRVWPATIESHNSYLCSSMVDQHWSFL